MSSWADRWRKDFPALASKGDRKAIYLDSACMSLTPREVLTAQEEYYTEFPGCGGRSVHRWSSEVTDRVETVREEAGRFFGAPPRQMINVRNTTEAINLVARGISWKRGDVVLVSNQEHNSNLVVWQELQRRTGLRLKILPLPEDAAFDVEEYQAVLEKGVRLVSFFHGSNLDGRLLPAREIVELAHDHGAQVLLDGSQAAPHHRLDLERSGPDYYALSLHKMLGPTGTGLLYGRTGSLETLRPLISGGETVAWTDYRTHQFLEIPERFEAGLQNYAGILGAGAALRYLAKVDFEELRLHETRLQARVDSGVRGLPLVRFGLEKPEDRGSVYNFVLSGIDAHDTALFLDAGYGVMVRSGMNCVHSWYRSHGYEGSVRASFYLYTTEQEVDQLVNGLREIVDRLGPNARVRVRGSSRPSRRAPAPSTRPSHGQTASSSPQGRPRSRGERSSR